MPKRTAKPKLGRLEKLDPTDYWQTQADFQQWLIDPETLELLGEATGLALNLADAPPPSHPYALLLDAETEAAVLVVADLNVPQAADLGRLLTWAAAEAVAAVIWVAPSFATDLPTTLDWLNLVSEVPWLGLTVELWQIGKTAMAANFIPIGSELEDGALAAEPLAAAQPLEAEPAEEPEPEPLTELQQENLDFWSGLCDRLDRQGSLVKPGSPSTEATMGFAIARAGFRLNAILDRDHHSLYTELLLSGIDAQPHFHLLAEDRNAIADAIGLPLIWDGSGEQACMVASALSEVDLTNRDHWPNYQAWFCDCLERFYEVFSERIKQLDANGYQPQPRSRAKSAHETLILPVQSRG